MKFNKLGRTGLEVSEICLGSMTWGTQNSEAEGHEQMDYAVDEGVNIFDTAEMYPTTPMSPETVGRTEEIIGTWFEKSGKRDKVVLATKITGEGSSMVRDGAPITAQTMREAVEGSLKRLRTDYIDIYQLHWPNRGSYHFRKHYKFDASNQQRQETLDNMLEVLQCFEELRKEGKVHHPGLSNESAWGTAKWLELSEKHNLPRMVTIQNEYSLLNRIYDTDLAELSHHEDCGLLAWSPLAAGILSGKYADGSVPAGSRKSINDILGGRWNPYMQDATADYLSIAKKHGLDPAQLALSFCLTRPFMTSVIIGATTMEQLKVNIAAKDVSLSDDVMVEIQEVHRKYPSPM